MRDQTATGTGTGAGSGFERWSAGRQREVAPGGGAGRRSRRRRGRSPPRPSGGRVAVGVPRRRHGQAAHPRAAGRGARAAPGAGQARGDGEAGGAGRGPARTQGRRGRPDEAWALRAPTRPGSGRRSPLTLVWRGWRVARARAAAPPAAAGGAGGAAPGKRGPRPPGRDAALVERSRGALAPTPCPGEGERPGWARPRSGEEPVVVGQQRVPRRPRRPQLLAPTRPGHPHGPRAPAGPSVTAAPNVRWGTDGARCSTAPAGWCRLFTAVDHHPAASGGHYVTKRGDRFAALEPVRPGGRTCRGAGAADRARGLALRHAHGPRAAGRGAGLPRRADLPGHHPRARARLRR